MVLKNTEMSGKSRKNRYKTLGYLTLQITSNFSDISKMPRGREETGIPTKCRGVSAKASKSRNP